MDVKAIGSLRRPEPRRSRVSNDADPVVQPPLTGAQSQGQGRVAGRAAGGSGVGVVPAAAGGHGRGADPVLRPRRGQPLRHRPRRPRQRALRRGRRRGGRDRQPAADHRRPAPPAPIRASTGRSPTCPVQGGCTRIGAGPGRCGTRVLNAPAKVGGRRARAPWRAGLLTTPPAPRRMAMRPCVAVALLGLYLPGARCACRVHWRGEDRAPMKPRRAPLRLVPRRRLWCCWGWGLVGRSGAAGRCGADAAVRHATRGGGRASGQGAEAWATAIPPSSPPLAGELNALLDHNHEVVERPAHPRRQSRPRAEDADLRHAGGGRSARPGRSRLSSTGRRRPCAARWSTTCAARAPPPAPRVPASGPRWPRCWTRSPAPWSASSAPRGVEVRLGGRRRAGLPRRAPGPSGDRGQPSGERLQVLSRPGPGGGAGLHSRPAAF